MPKKQQASLSTQLRKEFAKLRPVDKPKLPLSWNRKTGEFRDSAGRLVAICGPSFIRALRREVQKHQK